MQWVNFLHCFIVKQPSPSFTSKVSFWAPFLWNRDANWGGGKSSRHLQHGRQNRKYGVKFSQQGGGNRDKGDVGKETGSEAPQCGFCFCFFNQSHLQNVIWWVIPHFALSPCCILWRGRLSDLWWVILCCTSQLMSRKLRDSRWHGR